MNCFHCCVVLTPANTDKRSYGMLGNMPYNECVTCQAKMDAVAKQYDDEPIDCEPAPE